MVGIRLHQSSAGSGKTEVVAQLMAGGADPAGIIAFTFTERAADELKARISARVEERLGPGARWTSWARRSQGRSIPTVSGCCSSTCPGRRPSTASTSGG
jgi:superfamily I DNA/RNA helicase